MTADRAAGLVVIGFGLLLYAVVIPWQVETADYGWLRPRTLPRILAVVLVLGGIVLTVWPGGEARPGAARWGWAAAFAAVLILGLFLISQVGFVWVAPGMALAVMLLAGERRPLWLALGTVAMPAAIWFAAAVLLERPLP